MCLGDGEVHGNEMHVLAYPLCRIWDRDGKLIVPVSFDGQNAPSGDAEAAGEDVLVGGLCLRMHAHVKRLSTPDSLCFTTGSWEVLRIDV